MKQLITILSMFVLLMSGVAQTGEYKKILNEKDADLEVFFDKLREFQKENAEFSNVYYQLAKVELEIFSNLDPIVERVASRQRIYNVKTNFGLAKNYLDEREVERSPEWYDVPKTTSKDSIMILGVGNVDTNYKDASDYANAYETLIKNYDKAVFYYLKAREGFIEINTSADNLRQLFLKADDSLKLAVKSVGVNFDSSMYHIDIYRDTYQLLPYKKKRKVNITKRRIDHFRMNGITPANFLADEIEVWDYKQWSDRFLNLLKIEVDDLQDEIKTDFKFFMITNQKMIYGDDCIQANVDDLKFQRIINLITKYDSKSVLIDIFQYLIAKIEYGNGLVYERNCNNLDSPPTDDFLSRKARIHQNLYSSYFQADSLNEMIINSGHNQESFQWFFDEVLTGGNASQEFAESQKEENRSSFKKELTALFDNITMQRVVADSVQECFMTQDELMIPGAIEGGSSFCSTNKLVLGDTLEMYIGRQDGKALVIGAELSGRDYRKVWEMRPSRGTSISYFKVVGDSTYAIGGAGWISQFTSSGKEIYSAKLRSTQPIQSVSVNQLQGKTMIVQGSNNSYSLSKMNFSGRVESTKTLTLPGEYIGLVRQEQSLWFFSHETSVAGSKIVATVLDERSGAIETKSTYQFSGTMEAPAIIKNDNEYLTVLSENGDASGELIYALINYEGEVEYETVF